jgi:hypothetical protein
MISKTGSCSGWITKSQCICSRRYLSITKAINLIELTIGYASSEGGPLECHPQFEAVEVPPGATFEISIIFESKETKVMAIF